MSRKNSEKNIMPYNELAKFYDTLNYDIDYKEWADYIDTLIDNFHPKTPSSILDFACGTGTITSLLYDYGYEIYGLDKSEAMINVAKQKNNNIKFIKNNISDFKIDKKFDVVISTFDSINSITNKKELLNTFTNIHRLLNKDGILIFDINTEYGFKIIDGEFTYTKDNSGIFSVWTLEYDKINKLAELFLTVFEQIEGSNYTRNDFLLKERIYSIKELKSLLQKSGFKTLSIFDHLTFKPYKKKSFRVDFVAIKKE